MTGVQTCALPISLVAALFTATSKLLALPSTPTTTGAAPAPGNVEHLDQLFAAGREDGTSLALLRSRHDQLSSGEDDGVNALVKKIGDNGLGGIFTDDSMRNVTESVLIGKRHA